jgi:Kef-type K+ transport system membrane component KefB
MKLRKLVLLYLALTGIPVAAILAIMAAGARLTAPHVTGSAPVGSSESIGAVPLALLVGQIDVILVISRLVGLVFRQFRQPQVVGEMLAGILLGPSLFGWIAPDLSARLFPPSELYFMGAISQLGLVLFMFLVGLELNLKELFEHGQATILMSHVSIVAPFALASALSLYLYPRLSSSSVSFVSFALFMGAAMAITAFPVLARILGDLHLLRSKMGTIAIACAAVDDVSGWCILASIVVLVRTADAGSTWITLAGLGLFMIVMIQGVRRLLKLFQRSYDRNGALSDTSLALVLIVAMLSALSTEALGLHLLFGAFIAGAVMPKDPRFVAYLTEKFETLTVLLLLPLFFVYTGLRTRIDLVQGGEMWFYCAIIIAVAVIGKVGGTAIAARAGGLNWRESASLGVLMNTRGLMELVILNIGLDLKVISPTLFSMMVMMALFTTFMTTPLLHWIGLEGGLEISSASSHTTGRSRWS